ncbi:threonine ammonia-lyase, biosynthetic [Guyparkeria hydrothermalis]|nr:threonine ammonia-lyase, biosynthetic [Guyparkeria hydrothermalis]MCL7745433.1 threonine ammonia-lyase, biosynthetic [Guyparkeria hydrothermalis]
MLRDYLEEILKARVYDVAIESPLEPAVQLSERIGNRVLLKREDMQPVFSFKLRGAYHKIHKLWREGRIGGGVIAASAGNHAQGVALAAQTLGLRAVIVMPETTPAIKVDAVRRRGAEAVLVGDAFDDAFAHATTLIESEGLTYIPPYDDPDIIAGQGTVGAEILRHHPDPIHAIFVPVGGGGLIAGVAAYVKALRPEIRVIGVEPADAACLAAAMAADERVVLEQVGLFADGVAVRQIGEHSFKVAREAVDEVITVDTDEMAAAIKDIFDDTRSINEAAGALATAGLKRYARERGLADETLVAIASGANMNFDRLRFVAERAEIGEHREALYAVTIPERPGAFLAFCELLGRRQITEFNYRYADADRAHIFVGIKLAEQADRARVFEQLKAADYPVIDLTDNEMAKLHGRHMVGGHAGDIADERLFRFEFPERPGALLKFLSHLGARWNISLFHYRNHGADYGRVLVGIQVPEGEVAELTAYLERLRYPYWAESDNPVYPLFLA